MTAVRWAGPIPGDKDATPAVLIGPTDRPGPAVLQVGSGEAMVALAAPDEATPDDTETEAASRANWSLVSTGVMTATDLVAVRVPERDGGHAVISDRLLVVARAGATRVEAVDAAGKTVAATAVTDGTGLLTVPISAAVNLRALDPAGQVVASTPIREQVEGQHLFGEAIVSNW